MTETKKPMRSTCSSRMGQESGIFATQNGIYDRKMGGPAPETSKTLRYAYTRMDMMQWGRV